MSIRLNNDPEMLFSGFTTKHRNSIRRAQKNKFVIESGGYELVEDFYTVMESSWHRMGTPLYRRNYFDRILSEFPDNTRIFVCRRYGRPVAVAFNGYFHGTVEGMWAGGQPEAWPLQANYAMYWEMIRDACLRGCHTCHLGRSTANSGAEDFKKKWNATSQQLHWYFYRPDGGEDAGTQR